LSPPCRAHTDARGVSPNAGSGRRSWEGELQGSFSQLPHVLRSTSPVGASCRSRRWVHHPSRRLVALARGFPTVPICGRHEHLSLLVTSSYNDCSCEPIVFMSDCSSEIDVAFLRFDMLVAMASTCGCKDCCSSAFRSFKSC